MKKKLTKKNITWLLLCCLFLFSPMWKQEAWSKKREQKKEVQQKDNKQTELTATEIKKAKREAQIIGTLLLGVIISLGVTIFFVIIWGKRMRRKIRRKRASPTQRDDFWYLQPNENNQEIDKEPTSNRPPEE